MSKGSFNGLAVALAAASLFFGSLISSLGQVSGPTITWDNWKGYHVAIAKDLPPDVLKRITDAKWDNETWRKIFPMTVESGDLLGAMETPAMLGSYQTSPKTVTFVP
ncbi:MAG: hypothetical protein K0Q55_910, partial [Verrucomicrobia bacterium]|nr:hypothetical protein [Verrucomicrobiota bacterium]